MTRDDLKEYVLQLLSAKGPGITDTFFDDTWMIPALNRAQEEVQKFLIMAGELYYLKTVETPTVMNQSDYIWPTDLLKIHSFEIVMSGTGVNENKNAITPMTLNQKFNFGPQTGTPVNYVMKQDRFTLFPTPDTANQTLRLFYSYKIVDLTSGSQSPDIPEEYHKYVGVYAAVEGKVKDDSDPTNLLTMKNDFENRMKQMQMDRQYQTPRRVRETESDSSTWISY